MPAASNVVRRNSEAGVPEATSAAAGRLTLRGLVCHDGKLDRAVCLSVAPVQVQPLLERLDRVCAHLVHAELPLGAREDAHLLAPHLPRNDQHDRIGRIDAQIGAEFLDALDLDGVAVADDISVGADLVIIRSNHIGVGPQQLDLVELRRIEMCRVLELPAAHPPPLGEASLQPPPNPQEEAAAVARGRGGVRVGTSPHRK